MNGLLVKDRVFDGSMASQAVLIERVEHLHFVCVLRGPARFWPDGAVQGREAVVARFMEFEPLL